MFLAYFTDKKSERPFPFTLRSHNLNINPNPYLGYAGASQTTRLQDYKWLPLVLRLRFADGVAMSYEL